MEASIWEKEFGTTGESLLERALAMYLLALSARHVVLPLRPSLDYKISTQIGHALLFSIVVLILCIHLSDATADAVSSTNCDRFLGASKYSR